MMCRRPGIGHRGSPAGSGGRAVTKYSVFLSETEAVLCPEGNAEQRKVFK